VSRSGKDSNRTLRSCVRMFLLRNRIYNHLLELERLVQGKSESAVEVSRLTDSI
jgi:hypothetical protein